MAALSLAQAQGNVNWSWNVNPGTVGNFDFTNTNNWTVNNSSYTYAGGSVIDNGGIASVVTGDSATDKSGNNVLYIGGYSIPGDNGGTLDTTAGGNGYLTMTGGTVTIGQQSLGTSFLADG